MTLHPPKTLTTLLPLSSVLIISLLMLFASCSKGDTGPAGATGATGSTGTAGTNGTNGAAGANGANGANGATGAVGPKGATGSANVIYSAWFTPPTYTKDTVFGVYGFYYNKTATAITQPILDSGVVLVYGKLDGYTTSIWPANQVGQLPIIITYIEGTTTYVDTWSALVTLGNVKIEFIDDHNLYNGISNAHQFRYIIIPGGVATTWVKSQLLNGHGSSIGALSTHMGASQETIDYTQFSYEEVCQRLGIPQ